MWKFKKEKIAGGIMGILDEIGKKKGTNINAYEVLDDIRKWSNAVEAQMLMIKSCTITLKAYVDEMEGK